jgi:pimeloyl-ACP methyl ester carboxylesterase
MVFAGGGSAPEPPGQATTGYGSSENYICSGYTEVEIGDGNAGTRIWYYIPDVLKNGSSAPVVIILHGFMLLAPDIYLGHITHLTNQGYIVLFPQFNLGGFSGMLSDTDQNDMLARAIDAVDWALDEIGSIAETDNITMFGHSLGGLLAMCWEAGGGIPIESKVLAAPCIDTGAAPSFVNVTVLDYEEMAPSSTCPVMIIVGNQDDIAPVSHATASYNALTNASSKVVYEFFEDNYGDPDLDGDHMVAIQDDGWMPSWLMSFFGGDGEEDAFDYRIFYAAVDAANAGQTTVTFDMGEWSDDEPVNAVQDITP